MTFLTPCFVRVEDQAERDKLIEWLEEIGYTHLPFISDSNKIATDSNGMIWLTDANRGGAYDAGTSVDLFRALAAMNDENCSDQWFTDGQNWGLCKDKYWAVQVAEWDVEGNDDMLEMAINPQCHKATAEEIVEYFKKRGK